MRYIRNMDAQFKTALRRAGQADSIIDILGRGTVDGEDRQAPQIQTTLGVCLRHRCILQLFGLLPHFLREAAPDILCIQQRLCAALGLIGTAKAHGDPHPVVLLPGAPLQDLHSHLISILCAAFTAAHQLHGDSRAIIRHKFQSAVDPFCGAHQVVMLGQDRQDLALITALHPGMGKLLHQDLIPRHCATGKTAGDEHIALAILQHYKCKILTQLDHLAEQCLFCTAGPHRKEHSLPLADHSLAHQLIQRLHDLAVRSTVPAKTGFQGFYRAGLHLDRMLDLITNCHKYSYSFSTLTSFPHRLPASADSTSNGAPLF